MAKNEEKQTTTDEAPRVYKAASVHKRRSEGRGATGSSGVIPSMAGSAAKAEPREAPSKETTVEQAGGKKAGAASQTTEAEDAVVQDATPEKPVAEGAPGGNDGDESKTEEPSDASDDSAVPDGLSDAQDQDAAEESEPKNAKKSRWKLVVGIIVGILLAALLVLAGFIGGSRWVRFNDEADFQGKWYVYGTTVPLTFSDGSIVLNDETAYSYRIDPTAKTIEYTFGNLAGRGRYWFNDKRDTLVITDGEGYTMWSTLFDDIGYGLSTLFGNKNLPKTDASIVLTRMVVTEPVEENSGGKQDAPSEGSESSSASKSDDILTVSDIMMPEENGGAASEAG